MRGWRLGMAIAMAAVPICWMSPSGAAEPVGAGLAAADVRVTATVIPGFGEHDVLLEYSPAIKLFGTLTVAGTTYTGGFWVNGVSWTYRAPNCFPNPLPFGRCPVLPPLPPADVSAQLPTGASLTGFNDATGQWVGGTCGGSGSTARLLHGTTHVLHLGCGLTVDGAPGGWVWIDAEMAGVNGVAVGTAVADVDSDGIVAGVYSASA